MFHILVRASGLCVAAAIAVVPGEALAAGAPALAQLATFNQTLGEWFGPENVDIVYRVFVALLILLGGWLASKIVASLLFKLLCRTKIDDILAEKVGLAEILNRKTLERNAAARVMAKVAYYLLLLIVLIATMQYVGLTQAAQPIEGVVSVILLALPLIGKAILILVVAYILARLLRRVVTVGLGKLQLDQRFGDFETEPASSERRRPFAESAGAVGFWFVMAIGIVGALDALQIDALVLPLRSMLERVTAALPSVAVAAVIVFGGWLLARIVFVVVRKLLAGVGLDELTARLRAQALFEKRPLSEVLAWVAMAFVLVQTAITALEVVKLRALADPLIGMISQFWGLIPSLLVASLIVFVGVVLGRILRAVVTELLQTLGFDKFMAKLGFGKLQERSEHLDDPSDAVGLFVQVGVVLVALAQAFAQIGLSTWSGYVDTFLAFAVQNLLVAAVILAVGFAIGNATRDLIASRREGDSSAQWLGSLARYAILVFAFTMALTQLQVAPTFITLAFGLLFGALCLAAALAFGLGGRDVAGDIVSRQYEKQQQSSGITKPDATKKA